MEETMEKRVWQRVRGEPDRAAALRECLARQGRLWSIYRNLSRRGGKYRVLLEQKESQIACMRGMMRILTGQAAAHAACLALKTGVGAPDVDIKCLQTVLENDDVMVHFPDEYLPEDRTVVIHGKNAAEIEGGHL